MSRRERDGRGGAGGNKSRKPDRQGGRGGHGPKASPFGGGRRPEPRGPRQRPAAPVSMPQPPQDAPAAAPLPTAVQTVTVSADESGMRLDRFFEARYPGLSFSHIQRIIRKGEVRVNGKRAQPKDRLQKGQAIRIPPLKIEPPKPRDDAPGGQKDRAFIKSITLYEDDDVLVLDKPMGLAVQGGSGTYRHLDGMLGSMTGKDGQRPRLVHRLDKDTSGCLLVAKTRFAATALTKILRAEGVRKVLVSGVAAKRVLATSRQPEVSLSSRCTRRGRWPSLPVILPSMPS